MLVEENPLYDDEETWPPGTIIVVPGKEGWIIRLQEDDSIYSAFVRELPGRGPEMYRPLWERWNGVDVVGSERTFPVFIPHRQLSGF